MRNMSEIIPESSPLFSHEVLLDQLIECGRLFHSRGWSVGTSSNYSAVLNNDPAELIVTASGKDKGRLGRLDFVHIGADGSPIEPDQPKSSAETMLHVVLAEQNDIGSILHTHSVWGTLLSDRFFEDGGFEIEGFEMLKGLEGITTHEHNHWLPIFENTQDIPALAELVRERLSDPMEPMTHGFLIRKHGLYTWGKDVFSARRHIEIYEFLFECIARKNGFPVV
ncbi:methylthioribulose 1-phosphate dehydratase [Mariniblastus sp.]|jgi:methylthioribulose-1-phosphate dehydratase|nr:methylthioribulose 1-phosphate dehydratase [Mariniblastus sp.]MDB4396365.1 methylthioribulose 1-phosphate dehydratase [bacterium]MDC0294252.1 methylthioribulose 1-phosphate dehydratase [Mariniblastus sp.]